MAFEHIPTKGPRRLRIAWLVLGSIGLGVAFFGIGASLDEYNPSAWKFLVSGLALAACSAIGYRWLSTLWFTRRRPRGSRSRKGAPARRPEADDPAAAE